MKRFAGHKKFGKYLLSSFEEKILGKFTPLIGKFFQTYELTWFTLLWSFIIVVCSYLAKENILWLLGVSMSIALQYLTDHFDGKVGRKNKTGLVKWGYFMDHFLDYVFLCSIIIGYSFLIDPQYVFFLLLFFAIFTGFMINSFLEFSITNTFRISYFGVGPTEIRIGFILLNFLIIKFGPQIFSNILPVILFLSMIFLIFVVRKTQKKLWSLDMKERINSTNNVSKRALGKRHKYFKRKYFIGLFLGMFLSISIYVYLTNPFHNTTIVKNPFTTTIENNQIVLHKNFYLNSATNDFQKAFAYYKSGLHILVSTYFGGPLAKGYTENEIISEIHKLRFDPKYPYLISGDQFSVLYPRNLGIFYSSILNPFTAQSINDWENRQRIYLQSTAFALETFSNANNLYTTIVPVGFHTVTPINIFAYPSDSLYGILYALDIMQNRYYPENKNYPLQTKEAATQLKFVYKDSLKNLLSIYINHVYDEKTGLIKKNIFISSARDGVKRRSSFYDNVIFWKTLSLASKLEIKRFDDKFLEDLKNRILEKFWYEKEGYFLNDLSGKNQYSSDWLIAVDTGFLKLSEASEKRFVENSIEYIIKNNIDIPFALRYQKGSGANEEFAFVKFFVPSYGTDAIWSYWGIEYIKTLLLLYEETKSNSYLEKAKENIVSYESNIVMYKGFPEVYTNFGLFLQNTFYKSIRQTGWVVGFEETKWLLEKVSKE